MRWARGAILGSHATVVYLIAAILMVAALAAIPGRNDAALTKPTYAAGDHWVYVLEGSLDTFPGINASQTGMFHFDLVGRVDVNVLGFASVVSGGHSISAVRVDTRASGFLNGTFTLPIGPARITGSFTTTTSEFWEDQSYLTVQSNTTTSYLADIITFGFPISFVADLRLNASTSISLIPPFALDVGQSTTAALETHLVANTTVAVAGRTQASENQTDVSSVWRREALSRESVSVEAGTFSAYKLNQTLGSFPGIASGISGGGNETAYFSNDTGNYVKRDAYANGTRLAEMRLKSYSYGVRSSTLSLVDWLLLVTAVAVGFLLVLIVWRRRKKRIPEAPSGGQPQTPVDEKGGGHQGTR